MSIESRREFLNASLHRYQKSRRKEKATILDEFVAATGFNRKYAIRLLNGAQQGPRKKVKRPRAKQYGRYDEEALVRIWKISGRVASKRLVPGLPDLIEAMERCQELELLPQVRKNLLQISTSTCDRLLSAHRREHGKSMTTAGTLLKHSIPIRTFADWQESERRPGYCEIDTVAHCGDCAEGDFAYTLTVTDVFSGWTEVQAIANRGQMAVFNALLVIVARLPFPLLGLDCDNGGEFINRNLATWCAQNEITFTRGRPNKKNDQCYVEQKNWPAVRQNVGYRRYQGAKAVKAMNELYHPWNLLTNYFVPSLKLQNKQRNGAKVTKHYETAKTAYRRLIEWEECPEETRKKLTEQFESLNPAKLRRLIDKCQSRLLLEVPTVLGDDIK